MSAREVAAKVRLFRREALDHKRYRAANAALLQLDDTSTRWGFRLLAAGMVIAALFLALGRMNEYASGPAFVRLDQSLTLTAGTAGLVAKVEVTPGQTVEEGAVLVRFRSQSEGAELEAASREFDDELAKLLQRPDDPGARERLVNLRARRELARTHVEQRTLRAPRRGTVGDIRVHEGEAVDAGAPIVELQEPASVATVIALLPGRYRPLLHGGSPLRFELDGFHHRAYEVTIDNVGDQVVGPAEAARYVGRDSGDTVSLHGPVVVVQAKLAGARFEVDGETLDFANGMYGTAESVVRNEPVAFAFVPSLKPWVEHVHPIAWLKRVLGGRHA